MARTRPLLGAGGKHSVVLVLLLGAPEAWQELMSAWAFLFRGSSNEHRESVCSSTLHLITEWDFHATRCLSAKQIEYIVILFFFFVCLTKGNIYFIIRELAWRVVFPPGASKGIFSVLQQIPWTPFFDEVPFVSKCVCWKLAVPSAGKTLTLNIIEEVSVGMFVSITCHLKYDSAVTAGPWGLQSVGTAIWLPWSLQDSLRSNFDPEIINMALEASAFCFSALVV